MSKPLNEEVQAAAAWIGKLRSEVGRVIVGQKQVIEELLVAMLVMEAAFGVAGLIAAPVYYAYLKRELADADLV